MPNRADLPRPIGREPHSISEILRLLEGVLLNQQADQSTWTSQEHYDGIAPISCQDVYRIAQSEERRFSNLVSRVSDIAVRIEHSPTDFSGEIHLEDRIRARKLLEATRRDLLVDVMPTIDFALELRLRARIADSAVNANVFAFLLNVSGTNDALERENHDSKGYHFHHVDTKRGERRTNILLTFDPSEKVGPPDSLHWEFHGSYADAAPTRWGTKRCIAIHSAARPSIKSPGKSNFLRPGRESSILYRR